MPVCLVVLLTSLVLTLSASAVHANDPVAFNNYAIELQAQGKHESALEQLQKAYGMYPYDPVIKRNLAEAYTFVGERQLSRNEFDNAAASFDKARELFPDAPRYYILRGIALYFGKYYDAALNELERARGMGGEGVDLLYYLGRVHYDTGNLTAALEAWDKAIVLNPDHHGVKQLADKARRELAVEGQMTKGFSSRFVISYEGDGTSHLASEILDTLEDAYNRVGSDLSHFPTARIPVILYTRKDYRAVTASPDWSGGLYDGKIRLPVGGADALSPMLQGVLFHEYTHVLVSELTHGNCPTWLNEGLAELSGRSKFNQPLSDLVRAVRQGALLPLAKLEGGFGSLGAREVALAYQQSYSVVSFMVKTYGWYKVKEVLVYLGSGLKIEAAMKKAFGDFGLDYGGVVQEWQGYVAREFADSEAVSDVPHR
jgi:tetratricopeptide (TPR) repeat protein